MGSIAQWLDALADDEREVAQATVDRLLHAGARTPEDLHGCVTHGADGELAAAATWLLGRLGHSAATDAVLRHALDEHSDARVRAGAALALGELGARGAVATLERALEDDRDAWVRESAAHALGDIGARSSVSALVATLERGSELPSVRGEAASALGIIGDRDAAPPLTRALRDPDPEVRFFAATALGTTGDERAVSELEELVRTDHCAVSCFGTVSEQAARSVECIRLREADTEEG